MTHRTYSWHVTLFTGLIVLSLLIGWMIPGFYSWTDSDQSRPSPLLWKVPLWSAVGIGLFSTALPWLPILTPGDGECVDRSNRWRFGLRALMIITAAVALLLAVLAKFPMIASCVISATVFGYFIYVVICRPRHRLPAAALLACMILPYNWILGYDELSRLVPTIFYMIAGLPALVPGAYTSMLIGEHFADNAWPSILITAMELGVGLWLIQLGPKRSMAFLLTVLWMSALGSLAFYQMCIM